MGTNHMAMLRLIVAVALVATALSAPTWTKQLTMLSSSSGFTEVSNCACTNCVAPFWNSGISTSGGNKPLITKEQCETECQNRDSCVFALFDDKMPVNNKRIFNLGTSNEKSITINRGTIWYNDTSVVGGQLIYRTHAINEFTCPSTFTSNGKTFSLSFSGDNVTITNQGSGGWSQDAEVTCAKKCGKARNEYHQNGATDDADCHWKAGGDLFHNGADTSIDSTNTRNFCWLYDTNHGMRPTAAGNGNSQYTCFTKNSAYSTPAPAPQYQYSDLGSNSCPSGCSAINDLQTCKNLLSDAQSMNPAASQLGGNTAGTGSGGNYGSGRPGGCFLHNPNKHIHFNTDSTGGNSHGDDYKICKC